MIERIELHASSKHLKMSDSVDIKSGDIFDKSDRAIFDKQKIET